MVLICKTIPFMCKILHSVFFILNCCSTEVTKLTEKVNNMVLKKERTLLLNIDINKHEDEAFVKFSTKDLLEDDETWKPIDNIYKNFCLDLELGEIYDNDILTKLNEFFNATGLYFGIFFLRRCSKRMSNEIVTKLYDKLKKKYFFDLDISIKFDKSLNLTEKQKKRLEIIINELYYNSSGSTIQVKTDYKNIEITIQPLDDDDELISNERYNVSEYFYYGFPRMIFSKHLLEYLQPLAWCFKIMLRSGVPKYVKYDKISSYLAINELLEKLNMITKNNLKDLIYLKMYLQYHKFITEAFPSEVERIATPVMRNYNWEAYN